MNLQTCLKHRPDLPNHASTRLDDKKTFQTVLGRSKKHKSRTDGRKSLSNRQASLEAIPLLPFKYWTLMLNQVSKLTFG